jgi:myo-inositol-1(or 4)-monophosphatase
VAKRTRLQECLISTGFPYRPGDKLKTYLNMLGEVMSQCAGVRRPGAAALDLAYVAAGFSDGFFESGLKPWDVAAGSLLVQEAGGLVGNYTGESEFLNLGECLAGNPRVYGQLVSTLGKYSQLASAGEKARVRQAQARPADDTAPADSTVENAFAAALTAGDTDAENAAKSPAVAKTTLTKAKRVKPLTAAPAPDAPF